MNDTPENFGIELDDIKAPRLRDVAYSAGLDTEGKKEELIERLQEADVTLFDEGWTIDGDPFDVEERCRGNQAKAKTLLYAFKREQTSDDLLQGLQELAEDMGYAYVEEETENGKEAVKIVEKLNTDEDTKDATYTCAGTTADGEPCTREVDEEWAYCHQHSDQGEE